MNISQLSDEFFDMMPEFDDIPQYREDEVDEENSQSKKTIYNDDEDPHLNKIQTIGDEKTDSNTKISYSDVVYYQAKSKKSKIAPRSSLQFKLGPPYQENHHHISVYSSNNDSEVRPVLTARIDRGFDNVQGNWIGYKRNYFTSVASFQIYAEDLISVQDFIKDKFFVTFNGFKHNILYFATRLVASCCEDSKEMSLVQHTAKRDKGPQIRPPIHPIIPGNLPSHEIIRDASNIKNDSKKKKYDTDFYLHKNKISIDKIDPNAIIHQYPADDIIKVARYERVQFCSSINQKRPSNTVKHFKLTTILGAVVLNDPLRNFFTSDNIGSPTLIDGQKTFVPLVSADTPELVIRGRSPSNYPPNIVESKFQHLVDDNFIKSDKPHLKLFTNKQNPLKTKSKKKGYGKKGRKRASIKFGKKITNPPVLPSSRPTTGNFANVLSPKKNTSEGIIIFGEQEAKIDDEDDKSLQDESVQFMLNGCNETEEIENLILEHIIKENEMSNKDSSSVFEGMSESQEKLKNIDDEIFFDMDKFENDKIEENNGINNDEEMLFLKMKKGKRSFSESLVMPHFENHNTMVGIKMKKRSMSTVELPISMTADYLNPHSEIETFLNNYELETQEERIECLKTCASGIKDNIQYVCGYEKFEDSILDMEDSPRSKKTDIKVLTNYKTEEKLLQPDIETEPISSKGNDSVNFSKPGLENTSIQGEMFSKTKLNNSDNSYS